MILQSLVRYYEALSKLGNIDPPGWAPIKVSYALDLNDFGEIINVISLKVLDPSSKKMRPQTISLPIHPTRSFGKKANFLCDNYKYMLGVYNSNKIGNTENEEDYYKKIESLKKDAAECHKAAKNLHYTLLKNCNDPAAIVLLRFFDNWSAEKWDSLEIDNERKSDILADSNLIFIYNGQYIHTNEAIRKIWNDSYFNTEGETQPCLITGKMAVPAVLHPGIKGIPGAQPSGAPLVSFNEDAYCSYGHKKGLNAPTSEYAAFAYGSALNYLITTNPPRIGDTTVLFWAESAENQYRSIMDFCCWQNTDKYTAEDLHHAIFTICSGQTIEFDQTLIDPNMKFYMLGISPNAGRLSVRFFLQNSFGEFLFNIQSHQERLKIQPLYNNKYQHLPIWMLLNETSRDKKPAPNLAGAVLNAILNNTPYPATLLNGIELRIRADRDVNPVRAAIIKAYYLKKPHSEIPKEVLQVSLNPDCNDTAYVLGRLFSLLENIQRAANPEIKSTIRDKYFNSASSSPAVIFPNLINLAQKHLKKIDGGLKVALDKQLMELLGKLGHNFPTHLSLPQQGSFQLGYYHQTAVRYMKKEEQ